MSGTSDLGSRGAQLRTVATAFLRARPFVVAPFFAASMGLLVAAGAPRAQIVSIAVIAGGGLVFFAFESRRGRRALATARSFFVSLVLTMTMIALVSFLSGALRSPFLPMLFAPCVITFAAFGRGRESVLALSYFTALGFALAFVPPDLPFEEIPRPFQRLMLLAAFIDAALLLFVGVRSLTDAYASAADAAARAGEEAIAASAARLRSLESIGAKVAHEIRNPLSVVRGLVEVVSEGEIGGKSKERLAVAKTEVDRVDEIVRDYLSYARPLEDLNATEVELGDVARDVRAMLEARAQTASVRIVLEGPPISVRADRRRLKEAVLNLALNAIDAMSGGGTLALASGRSETHAWIEIRDSGRGMSAETLARLGEPFFTTKENGTGLGVALARRLAEQHGGALELESKEGEGTRAVLKLPFDRTARGS
jgi:signal transduction histidine kinase